MNILIVESAAKARTLQAYLGDGWSVLATGGHVQTLPHDKKLHGKDASKAFWANRPGELPSPPWVWTDRGQDAVARILDAAGDDATFWLATDPDREGEFIAWSLDRVLGARGPTHRVAFQEVTREAVEAAIQHPRDVDGRMVDSALVRKFLDRLVGYRASSLARSVIHGRGHSMGRVQTPTLGFVVERELEREAHVPIPYFEVHAVARGVDLAVRFHEPEHDAVWRDEVGRPNPVRTFDGELAAAAAEALRAAGEVTVTSAKSSERERRPDVPFTTDALLQAAGSRFGWSPRKTSALASMLYEAGHVTYIRTDSTRLAASAVATARKVVEAAFGEDHLGPGADGVREKPTAGPTQDAHEAIRPTRMDVEQPELDDADARRLYRLIRAHTLASQMAPSRRTSVRIQAASDGLDRPLTGSVSWRTFGGWEAAYAEFMGDVATEPPAIPLEAGAVWTLDPPTDERDNPLLIQDQTRPPPRYRPHTLIKAMKDAGIGRPSTYSRTVEKLEEREYVVVEDDALVPTEEGRAVWTRVAPLYAEDRNGDDTLELFSPDYTALMETRLDLIARGEVAAPDCWEEWRDQVRDLHAVAQEKKRAGGILPNQKKQLKRLLANAPDDVRSGLPVVRWDDGSAEPLSELTYDQAQALIARLRDAGVKPAPTDAQLAYLGELTGDLELSHDDLEALTGVRSIDGIHDADQASVAITALKQLHDERRPPSARQRRFIEDLIKESGLSAAEAARLVGAASLDELTGGPSGSASELIDRLKERTA
jgi:DNA topoisomerase I